VQNFKLKLIDQAKAKTNVTKEDRPTSVLDARFPYVPAAETDLAARFKAMGFKAKPKKPRFGK
jgi:hypothetical protein